MRADAARNREAVLAAARDLLARQGLEVSMDTIARTAGVGVGTVYRHFPDRDALVQAVLADVVGRLEALVDAAADGLAGADPAAAWAGFLAGVAASGLPPLLPQVLEHAFDRDVFPPVLVERRATTAHRAEGVLHAAQRLGLVRADLGAPDVMLLLAAMVRPLPGLPDELHRVLVARRLPLLHAALAPGGAPLPGPALTVDDLFGAVAARSAATDR